MEVRGCIGAVLGQLGKLQHGEFVAQVTIQSGSKEALQHGEISQVLEL